MPSQRPSLVGLVVLYLMVVNCEKLIITENKPENLWRTAGRLTGLLLQDCMRLDGPHEQFLLILQRCIERRSLVALDRSLKTDVIKLASGIELVRYKNDTEINKELGFFSTTYKLNEKEFDWKNQILRRIAHVLDTHVLKIHLNGHEQVKSSIGEARRRKRDNMFMSMLMFGIAAVSLIIVPMGFQFLAVLGGKALLLAKMALILTAIQGLKKIATSNVNYGLYATTPDHHHHGSCKDECISENNSLEVDDSVYVALDVDQLSDDWHYDRQWPYGAESHDITPSHNYYQVSEPHSSSDLLHTFQPRIETFKDIT